MHNSLTDKLYINVGLLIICHIDLHVWWLLYTTWYHYEQNELSV